MPGELEITQAEAARLWVRLPAGQAGALRGLIHAVGPKMGGEEMVAHDGLLPVGALADSSVPARRTGDTSDRTNTSYRGDDTSPICRDQRALTVRRMPNYYCSKKFEQLMRYAPHLSASVSRGSEPGPSAFRLERPDTAGNGAHPGQARCREQSRPGA
ncbi:hypothetical protein SALB1_0198 [Salinisphaera sp. LB1]|nr:hypothetical protein SALB1_0198 [Salinisphaera sp. LB1]